MQARRTFAIPLILVGVAAAGCGGETVDEASTSTSTSEFTAPEITHAALPESCNATPAGPVGLVGVTVTGAAGHPDGAQAVTWTTNRALPSTGVAVLTLRSGDILRGLKYVEGAVAANYVFDMVSASQENIEIPPSVEGNSYAVTIPAINVTSLGTSWTADLEINGESTGVCQP